MAISFRFSDGVLGRSELPFSGVRDSSVSVNRDERLRTDDLMEIRSAEGRRHQSQKQKDPFPEMLADVTEDVMI